MHDSTRTALVIGITGSFGKEVTGALLRHGWRVRALHRNPAVAAAGVGGGTAAIAGAFSQSIQWIKGDAMQTEDVVAAARGTELIVHAANPPNYRNWRGLALPMLDNTIAAARAGKARILMPATVYNFGSEAPSGALTEDSPQNPISRKGQVRVEMERKLQAAGQDGVRSIVVRAGDFFGPGAVNSWLTRGLVMSRDRARTVYYPGPHAVGHSWAYLPDLAEAAVRLLDCERPMSACEVFHFHGHWFQPGVQMAEAVCRTLGISQGRIKAFPWWLINLGSPFVNAFHEMLEMRYLWQISLEMDNAKLKGYIGAEPHTPLDQALAATLSAPQAVVAGDIPNRAHS